MKSWLDLPGMGFREEPGVALYHFIDRVEIGLLLLLCTFYLVSPSVVAPQHSEKVIGLSLRMLK
jgi:hypothetical protein